MQHVTNKFVTVKDKNTNSWNDSSCLEYILVLLFVHVPILEPFSLICVKSYIVTRDHTDRSQFLHSAVTVCTNKMEDTRSITALHGTLLFGITYMYIHIDRLKFYRLIKGLGSTRTFIVCDISACVLSTVPHTSWFCSKHSQKGYLKGQICLANPFYNPIYCNSNSKACFVLIWSLSIELLQYFVVTTIKLSWYLQML